MLNQKGQFFSPDLIIATLLFVVGLVIFIVVSAFVFDQVNLFWYNTVIDETAHAAIDSVVNSKGIPANWNTKSLNEIDFFGIAKSNNVIDENKLSSLIYFLDNNYLITKEMLGLGKFDFKLRIIDFNGIVKYETSQNFSDKDQFVYSRLLMIDNTYIIFEGVVANEQ
jgi:hypothetical protein